MCRAEQSMLTIFLADGEIVGGTYLVYVRARAGIGRQHFVALAGGATIAGLGLPRLARAAGGTNGCC